MSELKESIESLFVDRYDVALAREVNAGPPQATPTTKFDFIEYAEHAASWTQQNFLDEVCAALWARGMTNVAESGFENILTVSENEFEWELFIEAHISGGSGIEIIFTAVSDFWCTSAKRVSLVTSRILQAGTLTHATLPVTVVIAPRQYGDRAELGSLGLCPQLHLCCMLFAGSAGLQGASAGISGKRASPYVVDNSRSEVDLARKLKDQK